MSKHFIIGDSPKRVDALEKATGQAMFTADYKVPGLLHIKVVRSPHPHAKIIRIDTSRAERLPGVRGIVLPEDAPKRRVGVLLNDRYILPCDNIVRYIGEPVVLVAADTPDIAEDGADLVDIEYEKLPAVFDFEEAMKEKPPAVIHAERSRYIYDFHPRYGDLHVPGMPDMPNLQNSAYIRVGDVEKGFNESDVIVESRFEAESEQQCPLETHIAQAWKNANGMLTVRTSHQGYFHLRMHLSRLFDLPTSRVRILGPYLGGGFGSKLGRVFDSIVALAAMKLGRPVQLEYTRKEDLTSGGRNSGLIVLLKSGLKKSGEILALEAKLIIDGGAYGADYMGVIPRTALNCIGILYRIPHLKGDSYAIYTNNPPGCTFRGVEAQNVSWAMEQQMDLCAEKIGMDALDFRLKNFLQDGEENPVGEITESLGIKECLEKTSAWIGWGKKSDAESGWAVGKGLGAGPCLVGLGYSATSKVKVSHEGTLQLYFGSSEMGQGSHTVFAQMAAEEFRISTEQVKVIYGDTDITSWDWDNQGSRTTVSTGHAVVRACRDAKRQVKELAAPKMGLAPEDLEVASGKIYCIDFPSNSISIKDLFATAGFVKGIGEIIGRGEFTSTAPPMDPKTGRFERLAIWSSTAYAAEVAVNLETGEVKIKRLAGASDVGQPINSQMVEQQIDGGMAQGIGFTLTEQLIYDHGKLRNPDLVNYKVPLITDIPTGDNYVRFIVANPHEDGPYGAKGCGEGPLVAISGAIANAVYNAIGKRLYCLPLTREKVLAAISSR